MRFLLAVIRRDLAIAMRSSGQWLNPLIFYTIVVSLFPLGIDPGPNTLALIAPGVLWVSALLSVMLSLDSLFARDFADGTLEQSLLGEQALSLVVLAKVLAHWLISGLPLLLLSPLLGLLLQLPMEALPVLMAGLLLGTLTLSLLGAIGAALTVSLSQGGVLLSLLVLPLTVPVLIFGTSSVKAATSGLPTAGYLYLLGAFLSLSLALAPLAAAAALRVSVAVAE